MNYMKKLDKIILYNLAAVGVCLFIYGLFTDAELTLTYLGGTLLFGYMLFLFTHIALLMPSIGIGIAASDLYDNTFESIKERSVILAVITRAAFVTFCIAFVHLSWIWISVGLILGETNFFKCWEWFSTIIEQ